MAMGSEPKTKAFGKLVRTSATKRRIDIATSDKTRNMRHISCLKASIYSTFCLHAAKRYPPGIFHEDTLIQVRGVNSEDSGGSTCWRPIALEPWLVTEAIRNIPLLLPVDRKLTQGRFIVEPESGPRFLNMGRVGVVRRGDRFINSTHCW